jgi:hypothetical protein
MGQCNNNQETASAYNLHGLITSYREGGGGGGGGGGTGATKTNRNKGASTTDSYTMIFYSDIFNKFKPSSKNVQDHQVDSLETSMHLEYRFLDKDQGSYH